MIPASVLISLLSIITVLCIVMLVLNWNNQATAYGRKWMHGFLLTIAGGWFLLGSIVPVGEVVVKPTIIAIHSIKDRAVVAYQLPDSEEDVIQVLPPSKITSLVVKHKVFELLYKHNIYNQRIQGSKVILPESLFKVIVTELPITGN